MSHPSRDGRAGDEPHETASKNEMVEPLWLWGRVNGVRDDQRIPGLKGRNASPSG
jgi:hypothetical protein